MQEQNAQNKIIELEKKIQELKDRMPAHSLPVSMMQELEDLEEELESLCVSTRNVVTPINWGGAR